MLPSARRCLLSRRYMAPIVAAFRGENQPSMYLGFLRLGARKPAQLQGVGEKCALEVSKSGAAVIGKIILNRKRLQTDLMSAVEDIAYLLEVESQHCKIHSLASGSSYKQTVRELARESGYIWSGKLTPGRARSLDFLKPPTEF